jgi:hypothetical protein
MNKKKYNNNKIDKKNSNKKKKTNLSQSELLYNLILKVETIKKTNNFKTKT